MNNDEFLTSTASNGWLEKLKISNGEVGEVSREIVNAWMERLWELTKDYDPVDIWNINERAVFSMHFQRKKSQARGTNKPKPRIAIAFFVSAAAKKVIEPIVFGEVLNRDISRTWSTLNVLITGITIQVKSDG